MKSIAQLTAEHNASSQQAESRYTEVRDSAGYALQRILSIRSAIASFEFKLERATAELELELKTIDENYNK